MNERPEKTQKGNPHELTVRQHVFPRASIERFVSNGGVEVCDFQRRIKRRATVNDAIFCADRAWGHGPESGWMKDKEDAFQNVAEGALRDRPASFDEAQSEIIFEFYALWQARAERRQLPMQAVPPGPTVVGMRHNYTADELELLEKHDIGAFKGDGSIQMRHLMGPIIRLAMDRIRSEIAGRRWLICPPSAPMAQI